MANPPLPRGPADLVVRGRIATLGHDAGWGWAEGVAVAGGRVVALGPWSEVAVRVGRRTRVVELAPDEVLLPGLTDAHCHLVDAALAAAALDLRSAASLAEGLAAVAEHHRRLPPGRWLLGRGWAEIGRAHV